VVISLVIPAYNEAERLPVTLVEIEDFIKDNPGLVTEVVVVDDSSKDATVERAMRWVERLPLVVERLAHNTGKWGAIRRGIEIAKNDAILLLDADGSASVRELEKIQNLGSWLECKTSVFGSRFMKGSKVEGKSFFRRIISQGYRWYVKFWYFYGAKLYGINDMQTPFKLIYRSKIRMEMLSVNRFSGDIELAGNITGFVLNHPVHFVHMAGGSIKPSTITEMAIETAQIGMRLRRERLARNAKRDVKRKKKDL